MLTVEHVTVIQKVSAFGEALKPWRRCNTVKQVKITLSPALADLNQQPAAVIRDHDVGPMLRVKMPACFREDDRILFPACIVGAERVKEHAPVVHLLAGGDIARARVARVIEIRNCPGATLRWRRVYARSFPAADCRYPLPTLAAC